MNQSVDFIVYPWFSNEGCKFRSLFNFSKPQFLNQQNEDRSVDILQGTGEDDEH